MNGVVVSVSLVFLAVSLMLARRGVVRGREVAAEIKRREPEFWESVDEPEVRWFLSLRGQRWARFLISREYQALDHPDLVEACESLRRHEVRVITFVVAGFGLLLLAVVAMEKPPGA